MAYREIRLKYLHTYVDARGKLRAYFNQPRGKRIPLPLPLGSPEFVTAYAESLSGRKASKVKGPIGQRKNDFDTLVRLYFGSPLFKDLSPSTQKSYRRVLLNFCAKHGKKPVSKFERIHADSILGQLSGTPQAANNLRKRLSVILNYAVDIRMISANPVARMKGYKSNEDGFHSWTDAEIDQFIKRHPLGTKPYLALMLMLCTGQRKSDASKMGWADLTEKKIAVKQQKTKVLLLIPIAKELSVVLADLPKHAPTFLLTEYGKPFTSAGLGNWMRDRCDEANLPGCSSHGLRKACTRKLAEAGCSHHEIKAITGHKTDAEVRRYTQKVNQARLAERAVNKLQMADETEKSANLI